MNFKNFFTITIIGEKFIEQNVDVNYNRTKKKKEKWFCTKYFDKYTYRVHRQIVCNDFFFVRIRIMQDFILRFQFGFQNALMFVQSFAHFVSLCVLISFYLVHVSIWFSTMGDSFFSLPLCRILMFFICCRQLKGIESRNK